VFFKLNNVVRTNVVRFARANVVRVLRTNVVRTYIFRADVLEQIFKVSWVANQVPPLTLFPHALQLSYSGSSRTNIVRTFLDRTNVA